MSRQISRVVPMYHKETQSSLLSIMKFHSSSSFNRLCWEVVREIRPGDSSVCWHVTSTSCCRLGRIYAVRHPGARDKPVAWGWHDNGAAAQWCHYTHCCVSSQLLQSGQPSTLHTPTPQCYQPPVSALPSFPVVSGTFWLWLWQDFLRIGVVDRLLEHFLKFHY